MLFPVPCGDSCAHFGSFSKGTAKTERKTLSAFVGVKDTRSLLGSFNWSRGFAKQWLTFDLSYNYIRCIHHLLAWGGLCIPAVDQYSQSMPGRRRDGVPGGVSRNFLTDWDSRGGKTMNFNKCFRSKKYNFVDVTSLLIAVRLLLFFIFFRVSWP